VSEPRFFSVQRAFTQYLRDPDHVTPPADLAGERLAVYSHAVIKNAETFIGENFPRVKSLFPEAAWTSMVRDYFRRHASTTPLFVELPGEFLRYLDELRDEPDDPPFLYELAHFEFLETEVSADEQRIDETGVDPAGDVITGVPLVNPTLRLVRYTYPVHRIDVSSRPDGEPGPPTFIAAFRDRAHRFGFIDLNSASARAVELLLRDEGLSGNELMRAIAAELQHPDPDAVVAAGREILQRLVARDAILGTKPG
jgi:uncharacterized protein